MLEARSGSNGSALGRLFTAPSSPNNTRAERWLQAQLKRSRREGVFTTTVELTPELAELLLSVNSGNRKISPLKCAEYVRDINAGNWLHNGQTIIIADTGELNDGQHRCQAVVEAGRAIVTEATFGVARESRSTVDTGMKRSVGQHLGMAGFHDVNVLGHAVALIVGYQRYGVIGKQAPGARPTTTEILTWASANDISEHISWGWSLGRPLGIGVGLVAAISYVLHDVDYDAAEDFLGDLRDGAGLEKGHPILALRNLLINRKGGKAKYPWQDTAALFIKSWNRWRTGVSKGPLQFRSTGQFAEKFPKPE